MRYKTLVLLVLLALVSACKVIKYVPIETKVEVEVHDTTVLHKTDTLVKVPEFHLSDFAGLTDTLRLKASNSEATAWVDSSLMVLKGRLVQTGKIPVQIVEKERVVYKDSIRDREVPVPVEVPTAFVPWYAKALSAIGVLGILLLAGWIVLKVFLK